MSNDEAADLTRAGAPGRRAYASADVHALPFDDGEFDVVHAHQVLQHVADPVTALAEMARVTSPGGVVAARDSDYATFAWWPRPPELDRWLQLYSDAARANGGEPDAGRRLLAWAHAAGLADVTATSSTWCWATPETREWWGGMWADRILGSALADQLVREARATPDELQQISAAWRTWATHPDAWFSVHHGEVLCRVCGVVPCGSGVIRRPGTGRNCTGVPRNTGSRGRLGKPK